jgi:hypothetical protein
VAGTAQDLLQAEWMRDRFLEAGLDEAKTIPYDVLLSYPRVGVMNKVSLIDEQGRINYTTAGRQPPLGSPEEFSDDILHNFNAFSANGVVEVPNELLWINLSLIQNFDCVYFGLLGKCCLRPLRTQEGL